MSAYRRRKVVVELLGALHAQKIDAGRREHSGDPKRGWVCVIWSEELRAIRVQVRRPEEDTDHAFAARVHQVLVGRGCQPAREHPASLGCAELYLPPAGVLEEPARAPKKKSAPRSRRRWS